MAGNIHIVDISPPGKNRIPTVSTLLIWTVSNCLNNSHEPLLEKFGMLKVLLVLIICQFAPCRLRAALAKPAGPRSITNQEFLSCPPVFATSAKTFDPMELAEESRGKVGVSKRGERLGPDPDFQLRRRRLPCGFPFETVPELCRGRASRSIVWIDLTITCAPSGDWRFCTRC